MAIILNERRWVEDMLGNPSLGRKPSETLRLLARYYFGLGYEKKAISVMLEEYILRCDPDARIPFWNNMIDFCVKKADDRPLIEVEYIPVYKSEMEKIAALDSVLLKRLMFTLLCLSKFANISNPDNDYWVNTPLGDILRMADIKITLRRQSLLFNSLWTMGYIGYSCLVTNINCKVQIIGSPEEEVVARIDNFVDLGNQYMLMTGGNYFVCNNCGRVVRRRSPSQKWCKDCAAGMNSLKTAMNRKNSSLKIEDV